MSDIAIKVDNLSKLYNIGARRESYKTLRDTLADVTQLPMRKLRSVVSNKVEPRDEVSSTLWALRDVSFQVERGEVLGIIGRNGAGKSTMLKILSRITHPTQGRVEIFGRVGSLLEVGTGFSQELTGRENTYLNGAMLGMPRSEIDRKFDEIVAFADVERFIDTPVKRYSSGMYMRLAFAVAAHLSTQILIVDEVLAVGDVEFQKKCLGRIGDVAKEGRTVLFVSHNMQAIRTLCSRALLLNAGTVVQEGPVEDCLARYSRFTSDLTSMSWKRRLTPEHKVLEISSLTAVLRGEQPDHRLDLNIELITNAPHKPAFIAVDILDAASIAVMQALPTIQGFIRSDVPHHSVQLSIELPPLVPGRYLLTIWVGSHNTETLDEIHECTVFEITQSPTPNRTYPHSSSHGFIVPVTTLTYLPEEVSSESRVAE